MFSIITDHPVAYESFDHLYPCGTMYDNNTSLGFILEAENMFSAPIHMMDLGCSGGQLVADFKSRNHLAVGIEGSDFSVVHGRANWPALHNSNLFTADITKPFQVLNNNEPYKCDIITLWEVLEHIEENDLPTVFTNISNHLKDNGFFVASIGMGIAPWMDVNLHRTVLDHKGWDEKMSEYFVLDRYPYWHSPREDVRGGSYFVKGKKRI